MQDLFRQPQAIAQLSWYLVPLLVLAASLLGSTHCVGMCGGIVMALPARKPVQIGYHLGRLVGYLMLGALAGLAGDFLLSQGALLSKASSVLMALLLFGVAYNIWRGRAVHFQLPAWMNRLLQRPMGKALKESREHPWMGVGVGLLSMFLPCGWLYTFVLGALLTRNFWLGAAYLVAFWAGTVPLLAVGPTLVSKWLASRPVRQRQIVASIFILAGLLTVYGKFGKPLPVDAQHLANPAMPVKMHHGHGGMNHEGMKHMPQGEMPPGDRHP